MISRVGYPYQADKIFGVIGTLREHSIRRSRDNSVNERQVQIANDLQNYLCLLESIHIFV